MRREPAHAARRAPPLRRSPAPRTASRNPRSGSSPATGSRVALVTGATVDRERRPRALRPRGACVGGALRRPQGSLHSKGERVPPRAPPFLRGEATGPSGQTRLRTVWLSASKLGSAALSCRLLVATASRHREERRRRRCSQLTGRIHGRGARISPACPDRDVPVRAARGGEAQAPCRGARRRRHGRRRSARAGRPADRAGADRGATGDVGLSARAGAARAPRGGRRLGRAAASARGSTPAARSSRRSGRRRRSSRWHSRCSIVTASAAPSPTRSLRTRCTSAARSSPAGSRSPCRSRRAGTSCRISTPWTGIGSRSCGSTTRTTRRERSPGSTSTSARPSSLAATASCWPRTRRTRSSGTTSRRPRRCSSPIGRTCSSSTASASARR